LIVAHFQLADLAALHTRYDASVEALAALDPVLAYQLSSKYRIGSVLQRLASYTVEQQNRAGQNVSPSDALQMKQFWAMLNRLIEKRAIPDLAQAALRVAKQHGRWSLRETRKALKTQDSAEPRQEFRAEMEAFKAQLDAAAQAAAAAAAPN
jgi:hypothetical protein